MFDKFYEENFDEVKKVCGYNPKAAETVEELKKDGIRVVLATNPIFPSIATGKRIRWAGLEPEDFELYTSYENIGYCKPNPDYYREILGKLNLKPEECLALEDSPTGILSAYRAGCLPVMIPDLDQPGEDTQKLLFAKADSLSDIIAILKAQNGHL